MRVVRKKNRGRPKMINQAQLGDEFSKESEQKKPAEGFETFTSQKDNEK